MRRQRSIVYAGRGERILANLIDSVVLLLPNAIAMMVLGDSDLRYPTAFVISLIYYTFMTANKWQATFGKRLLNIYVARTDHHKMDIAASLERFLAYSIPTLPLYTTQLPQEIGMLASIWLSIFWFLPIVYTPERTGIHDKLCHTRVLVGKVGA